MRVLLTAYGSRGDVEPLVAVAMRLRDLGVDVRMCTPPDFAELFDSVGLPMVPIGEPARPFVTGVLTGKVQAPAEGLPARAAAMTATTYEAVVRAAEGCDVVLATGLLPAAAERLGIPYVFVAYFPAYLPSPHHPPFERPGRPFPPGPTDNRVLWDLDAESMNVLFGTGLNALRATVGLPPVDHFRDHVLTDRPWLATDPVLGPWQEPADLDVVQTGAWFRADDDRPLPADVEAFLQAGEPPVYVGFGSIPLRDADDVARSAVEAVRAQGRRVLLSRGWADLAPADDQDDCLAVGEVDHHALFPRVAAVVHHGGAGTTTTAARAGAPQVVVPQLADQPYWAGRVADLGIGAAHDGPHPTFESLSAALAVALTPEARARAAAVAARISTDGATVAAKLLLETAG
ncbi:glycosyl transferase [Kitasatospora herbaricolor]|uniref:glycosyltransferase n=1 Tax=Kitasatospora herbaricolor TaxID=68217 RepID=UPI00174E2258|nr:glycosyltransferase [Kitasatospora herbaricolor]MDQ0306494.1 vancomycin aglycone glucosyltransferase [Kitasatospora herbaricolor]GGV34369.1 glycosyl transferase [Kitasatospora herbaricolor]